MGKDDMSPTEAWERPEKVTVGETQVAMPDLDSATSRTHLLSREHTKREVLRPQIQSQAHSLWECLSRTGSPWDTLAYPTPKMGMPRQAASSILGVTAYSTIFQGQQPQLRAPLRGSTYTLYNCG